MAKIEDAEINAHQEIISQQLVTAQGEHLEFQDRLVLQIIFDAEKLLDKFQFKPVSDYLHIFPEASERPWQVASEWRQSVGLHGPLLPPVIQTYDRFRDDEPSFLFSPSTALRMAFKKHGLDARVNDSAPSVCRTESSLSMS